MIRDMGYVEPGTTLYIPFHTFDSNDPSASVTLTGLATTDIEIYKDGSTTQRASDNGYALLDTDGIDFDGITGIHGLSINLADNSTAGFYAAGSQYWVVISSVTVDGATINFVLATFRIGYQAAILNTTIATLSSQTSFTLTNGPAEDDALNGSMVLIHDVASAVQKGYAVVSDYTGSTKTVTLLAGTTFTAAATDNIAFYPPVNASHAGAVAYTATRGLAGTALPNAVADAAGGLPISDAGGLDLDARLDAAITSRMATYTQPTGFLAATFPGTVASPTNITAGTITTVTNLTNAPSDSSGVTTLLSRLTATRAGYLDNLSAGAVATAAKLLKYFQLALRKDSAIATDNSAEVTEINANGGSGAGAYANTTDGQEALRDRGDAAWVTATGFSTHSAADVWAVATRVLTAGTNIVLAKGTGITGFNDPTVGAIADAVWTELIADHTGVSGSTAAALNAAGSAGDPWNTNLPGSYGSGTAGKIIGDNINATISSRLASASYTAPDNATISTISTNVSTVLSRLGAFTGSGVNTVLGFFRALMRKDGSITTPSDVAGNYDHTTDSVEAIRDRGDAAWTTATGFSTHTAADVWANATRTLTSGANIVLAKGTGITGFNDISQTEVNAQCDQALADYDAPTKAEMDAAFDAVPTDVENAAAVFAKAIHTGFSFERVVKIIAAAVAGKTTTAGNNPEVFRDLVDGANQISVANDSNGNRTSITYGS